MWQELTAHLVTHPVINSYRQSSRFWGRQTVADWQEVLQEFQQAAWSQSEQRLAVAFCEGQMLRKQGLVEQAVGSFQAVLALAPGWPLALEALADVYYQLGQRPRVEECLNQALKTDNQIIYARLLYAQLFAERHNYKAAEDVLKFGLKLVPQEAAFYRYLGHLALSDGRAELATKNYQQALALAADDVEALVGLSSIELIKEDYAAAAKWLTTALQHEPQYPGALINQGFIYYQRGKIVEAERAFEQAIAQPARQGQHYFRLALFYWQRLANPLMAERYLRLATNLPNCRSDYYSALAVLLVELGQGSAAEVAARQALAYYSDNLVAWQVLSLAALGRGATNEAQEYQLRATAALAQTKRYLTGKLAHHSGTKSQHSGTK
jgi:Tfp pilus assembly protein PilF